LPTQSQPTPHEPILRCPVCGADVIVDETGRLVCRNGHVLDDSPVASPGTRFQNPGDEHTWFTGHSTLYPSVGMTQTGDPELDALTARAWLDRKTRVYEVKERVLHITRLLGIDDNDVVGEALLLAEKVTGLSGNASSLAAAAVYAALYRRGYTEPATDFMARLRAQGVKVVKHYFMRATKHLGAVPSHRELTMQLAARIAHEVAREADADPDVLAALAQRILAAFYAAYVPGRRINTPKCLAAAAVYIAARAIGSKILPYRALERATGRTEACIRLAANNILAAVDVTVEV